MDRPNDRRRNNNVCSAFDQTLGRRKDRYPEANKQHSLEVVGGYPFNIAPNLWEQVGADAYGSSPQEAVELAERLIADSGRVA